MSEKIIAYKGMDENMTCRGKQYEIGKTYTEERAVCCITGMHACENPLDVLNYYRPDSKTRFFEVECGGEIDREDGKDSKLACTELKVKGELKLSDFIQLSVKTTFERAMRRAKAKESGDSSSAATSGYYSSAATSGDSSSVATSGDSSSAATSGSFSSAATSGGSSSAVATGYKTKAEAIGKNSIAIANGAHSKALGAISCYLVLTEYDDDGNFLWAKMEQVDGNHIKEKVWYTLKNGEFVEAEP